MAMMLCCHLYSVNTAAVQLVCSPLSHVLTVTVTKHRLYSCLLQRSVVWRYKCFDLVSAVKLLRARHGELVAECCMLTRRRHCHLPPSYHCSYLHHRSHHYTSLTDLATSHHDTVLPLTSHKSTYQGSVSASRSLFPPDQSEPV